MKKSLFILALVLGSSSFLMAAPPGGGTPIGGVGTITVTGINGASYSTSTFRSTAWVTYHPYKDNVNIAFEAFYFMPYGGWSKQASSSKTATMQGTINGVRVSGSLNGPNFSWVYNGLGAPKGQVIIYYEGVEYIVDINK